MKALLAALVVLIASSAASAAGQGPGSCNWATGAGCTGSSAAVPGLKGTTATTETLDYIRTLTRFENVFETITPTIYTFSAYTGDDANPCTPQRPCRSFAYAKWLWQTPGSWIKFKNGEVWSPLTFTPTAGVSTCRSGETVTLGAAINAATIDTIGSGDVTFIAIGEFDLRTSNTVTGVTSGCTMNLAGPEPTAGTLTFTPDGGLDTCIAGETVTATSSSEILDIDAGNGVIVFRRLNGLDPATSDTVTGADSACSLDLAGTVADNNVADVVSSGTQDNTFCVPSSSQICDDGANFLSQDIEPGDCVYNSVRGPFAKILNVQNNARINLVGSITGNVTGDPYVIYDRACPGELSAIASVPGQEDRAVSLMEAESPEAPQSDWPLIDCNGDAIGGSVGSSSGLFVSGQVGFEGLGLANALRVGKCKNDLVSSHQQGRVIVMNITAELIDNTTDTKRNNCTTNHNQSLVGTINVTCTNRPFDSGGGAAIAPTGICDDELTSTTCDTQSGTSEEAFLFDINGRYLMDGSQMGTSHNIFQSTGSNVMLLGTEMECQANGSGQACEGVAPLSGDVVPTDGYANYFARTTVSIEGNGGNHRCYLLGSDEATSGGPMNYYLYNTTVGGTDCNRAIQAVEAAGIMSITARNLLLHKDSTAACATTGDGLIYIVSTEDLDTYDFEGLYNDDECFVWRGADPGDVNDFHTSASTANASSSIFQSNSVLDADPQFFGPRFQCDVDEGCFEAAEVTTQTIPFSSLHSKTGAEFCLKDLVKGTICNFEVGGSGNLGAR